MEVDDFQPDYEPEQEYSSPYPPCLYIFTETYNPPENHKKDYERVGIKIAKGKDKYINVTPHRNISPKILGRDDKLYYNEVFITSKTLLTQQMENNTNFISTYKLKWCSSCQEYTYNWKEHKKEQRHVNTTEKLEPFQHVKRTKTDPKYRILEITSNHNLYTSQDGERKIMYLNEEKESITSIYLKNSTSRKIKLLTSCGSNKNKGYITFVGGEKLGDFEIYNHQEILYPNQTSTKPIDIWTYNTCASSDLELETIIQELDSRQTKRLSQVITVYKNYCNIFYNSNISPKAEIWKHIKNVQFNDVEEEKGSVGKITKSSLLKPQWSTKFRHMEFKLEQSQTYKTALTLTPDESNTLETIRQETDKNNFLAKLIFIILAELSFYFNNQNTTEGKVTKILKSGKEAKERLHINVKQITTAALYLKTGDRALIMVKDVLVLPAKIAQIDSEEMVLIIQDRNLVQQDDLVRISPTLRIQPYTIVLNVLEELQAKKHFQEVASKLFTPTEEDCTPVTLEETRETCVFENTQLDDNQKTAVLKTLQAPVPGPASIIIGPPGTGKTTTIVEYVCQETKRGKKILVVCPTNQAVCALHHKLANMDFFKVHGKKILKFSTPSMKVSSHCYRLCTSVLIDENTKHTFPSVSSIKTADIVLSTLTSSHRLGHIKDNNTTYCKEFNVVICDEASFSSEASILIPITGQIVNGNRNLKLVLVGDPKQIRQHPRSLTAKEAPKVDIISRLMSSPVYRSNPHLHQHLQENYRNAVSICKTLKQLVYGKEMTAKATYQGSIKLYHAETAYQDMKSYSKNSIPEIEKIITLFKETEENKVLPTVLTYYSAQSHVTLAEAKRRRFRNFHQVRSSTAESIQGSEADEIIISLCLPKVNNEWQNDRNRTNVLFSRAKHKVMLVGDTFKMCESTTFRPILQRALQQGEVHAEPFILSKLEKLICQKVSEGK